MGSKLLERLKREAKDMKEREETRSSGTFEKINWFSPQKGDNLVRIMPNKNPEELFFKQLYIHYIKVKKKDGNVVNVPVRCLKDFDKTCPLCECYSDLVLSEETKDEAKDFRPIERYIYNLFDYSKKQVLVYAAPMTVHGGFMEWIEELDTDISDLELGHDFKIVKNVDPAKGTLFGTSYKVMPKLKATAVPNKIKELVAGMTDINTVYSEERIKEMNDFIMAKGLKAKAVKAETRSTPPAPPVIPTPTDDDFADDFADSDDGFADSKSIPSSSDVDDELERELRELGVN